MYDTSKLRGRIVEKYGTQLAFSRAINGSMGFISEYLQGHRTLSQSTITKWADALDISAEEIPIFFFTKKVHDTEHEAG